VGFIEGFLQYEDVQQLLGWALQRLPQLQPLAAAGWNNQQLAAVAGELMFACDHEVAVGSDYPVTNYTARTS
jgi:hypothetical protein